MSSFRTTVPLRVLIYHEDGEWVAHLLEMDLVATGETPEAAEGMLKDAFDAQVSFCIQEGVDPFRSAPSEIFKKWNEAQSENIMFLLGSSDASPIPDRATSIEFGKPDLSADRFELAQV